jgi:hypothetical protein
MLFLNTSSDSTISNFSLPVYSMTRKYKMVQNRFRIQLPSSPRGWVHEQRFSVVPDIRPAFLIARLS